MRNRIPQTGGRPAGLFRCINFHHATAVSAGVIAFASLMTGCVGHEKMVRNTTHPNRSPTISRISDQETSEGSAKTFVFSVADSDTPLAELRLVARTSNPAMVSSSDITFGGSGTERTVTINPVEDTFGQTTITIEVTDGDSQASSAFNLIVHPVNGGSIILPQVFDY